jgi:hypothetical protein
MQEMFGRREKEKRLFYRRIQKDKEKIFTKMRNEKFQNVLEI